MKNSKVLITGATGQLAYYIASQLAPDNTVHAIARFGAAGSMEKLQQAGVSCIKLDYTRDDLNQLDDDYDYVLHFATYQVPGANSKLVWQPDGQRRAVVRIHGGSARGRSEIRLQ